MRRTEVELPTVLIFATGGTIGMHDLGKGLEIDPNFGEILEHRANEIATRLGYRARVNQLQPAIESANADEETAPRIARAIRARVGAMRASAVVVTHGTDTLAYTASRLAFELADIGVPVTLTGSQLPHGAEQTDAFDNLSLAIRTVTQANPKAPVSVTFGGTVIPAVRATKSDAEGLTAFRAERRLGSSPRGLPQRSADGGSSIARVITFRFTPGVHASDLLAAVGGGPDALVLECYGAGNAPMAQRGITEALAEVSARMPVVAVTQCAQGSVDTERYAVGRQFAATGVIGGGDLTLEAAIAKVGYLIDQGYSRAEISELMQVNLVGELSPSTS